VPFLAHTFVEFAATVPVDLKLRGFGTKHLLKLSQRSRLPRWVLDRPKQGFNAPVSHWVLGPLRQICEDTLFARAMREWFDQDAIQRLWKDHQEQKRDNGLKLFGLLMLGLFFDKTGATRAPNLRVA